MSEAIKIYKVNVVCENCIGADTLEIPFKTLALDFIMRKDCKYCGNARTLRQIIPQREQ